jgi:predicted transcriptional regulator
MNRIFDVAAKQESLASAFRKLAARNLSIILVVDEQHLVGIVTLQNLMHSMSLSWPRAANCGGKRSTPSGSEVSLLLK